MQSFYPMKEIDGIEYKHVPVSPHGESALVHTFVDCFRFINASRFMGEATLVYCQDGNNIASIITIAYLMHCEKWTLKRSYDNVRKSRVLMFPHVMYLQQLRNLEIEHHGSSSIPDDLLYNYTTIEGVKRAIKKKQKKHGPKYMLQRQVEIVEAQQQQYQEHQNQQDYGNYREESISTSHVSIYNPHIRDHLHATNTDNANNCSSKTKNINRKGNNNDLNSSARFQQNQYPQNRIGTEQRDRSSENCTSKTNVNSNQ